MNCPQLTHLSLTGVTPFLREEILRFCREAPPEFNDHQRDVFCVFSGQKVKELRNFLTEAFAPPLSPGTGLDDEAPEPPFVGASSAPASARPFGVNGFNHPFDWAAPPPPALWVPHQHQGPPPAPRLYSQLFHPPPFNHPPVAQPVPQPMAQQLPQAARSRTSSPAFAQSAPSQQHAFMPPPLFMSRSHSPTTGGGQPGSFTPPVANSSPAHGHAQPRLPQQQQFPLFQPHPMQPNFRLPSPLPRHEHLPFVIEDGPSNAVAQPVTPPNAPLTPTSTTSSDGAPQAPRAPPNENPMAFPGTPTPATRSEHQGAS